MAPRWVAILRRGGGLGGDLAARFPDLGVDQGAVAMTKEQRIKVGVAKALRKANLDRQGEIVSDLKNRTVIRKLDIEVEKARVIRKGRAYPRSPAICCNPDCRHSRVDHQLARGRCFLDCSCTMYWGPLVPSFRVQVPPS